MAHQTLKERVALLEAELNRLKEQIGAKPPQIEEEISWWQKRIGAFKDNPEYEEAMRLGREYRESQKPEHEKDDRGGNIMIAYAKKKCFTPLEYLERERAADYKSEYDHGVIIPMPGASREHNCITFDTSRHIGNQLDGSSCQGFAQDMRVRVSQCDKYYYPDIVVMCGEPQFEDATFDVLLNPKLIIEARSESTERKDREEKFDCYETLESLTDYVLISQTEPRIEHFSRLEDGVWRFVVARGLEAVLALPAIGCSLRLADIYARVTFPPPPVEEPDVRESS